MFDYHKSYRLGNIAYRRCLVKGTVEQLNWPWTGLFISYQIIYFFP